MRSKLFTIAAVAIVTTAGLPAAAFAQAPVKSVAVASSSSAGAAAAKEEKKICKWLPKSGSRMTEKVCHTKSEWKQIEKDSF